MVHVCLTGTQPTTWNLEEAASFQNLRLVQKLVDSKPFAHVVWSDASETKLPEPAKVESKFAAPRKYRNGKLGKHFLARYGYRHRRTEGVLFKGSVKDANVSESMHFVFEKSTEESTNDDEDTTSLVCQICRESFDTKSALELHLKCPVRPPAIPDEAREESLPSGEKTAALTTKVKDTPKSEATLVEQCHDNTLGTILKVPSSSNGKRLRWFLQHSTIENLKFTKRLAESTIQAGLILVNGEIAKDSSRILKEKDTVTIQQQTTTIQNSTTNPVSAIPKKNSPRIEIVERSPSTSDVQWLVAVKPSGMRSKGRFQGTLESILGEQEQTVCSCISSLETSCSGLCVLVTGKNATGISVLHTMTVLVHGKLAQDQCWVPPRDVKLVVEAKWRKKKKRKLAAETQPEEEVEQQTVPARIDLQDICGDSSCPLSTVTVATREPCSSSICHYFRQASYPVVGDSFCKHEYAKLKRSIRNRIKNKLCMGCYRVDITVNNEESTTIQISSPDKLSAAHWERFLTDDASDGR
eukprot:CAMPEP_0197265084 /NCGR_PEP_ID=MMETSP1432-20130617/2186_1 /TAXON_ID=44447 /ORGANISM="Pseudo-nitzschia delicatissima, Strain UNC1205" /LENGTH=524 /DNA_ID=CAMNT_0042729793 /DNA_START=162 /DNA_END=1736 /DNA_ORIENTATION=-